MAIPFVVPCEKICWDGETGCMYDAGTQLTCTQPGLAGNTERLVVCMTQLTCTQPGLAGNTAADSPQEEAPTRLATVTDPITQ